MMPPRQYKTFSKYKMQLTKAVQAIWEDARKIMLEAKCTQKIQHDRNAFNRDLRPGDLVALKSETVPIGLSKKLHPKFNFPFMVISMDWPNLVIRPVGVPNDVRTWTVHVNRIKQYLGTWTHPTHGSIPEPTIARENNVDYLCRHCQKSYNDQERSGEYHEWAECEDCLDWLHTVCEGLPNQPVLDEHWYCKECRERQRDRHPELVAVIQDFLYLPGWIPGFGPFMS